MTQPMLLPETIAPNDLKAFLDDIETIHAHLDALYKARRKQEPEQEQAAISELLKTWDLLKALY